MWVLLVLGPAWAGGVQVTLELSDLILEQAPALMGGGRLVPCTAEPQPLSALATHLDRAEDALPLLDLVVASDALDDAEQVLSCLEEAVAGSLAARVPYLRGMVAALGEDPEGAQAAFEAALVLRPSLAWDDTWAPDLRPPFEAARVAVEARRPAELALLPAPAPGMVWVDGRPTETTNGALTLSPGRHWLQLPGTPWRTWALEVGEDDVLTLVVPGELGPEVAAWATDPARRSQLEPLLGLVVEPGTAVQVQAGKDRWRVETGAGNWEPVRPSIHPGRWVALVGGAVAAGSAVVATSSWLQARGAVSDADTAGDWNDYREARTSYEQAAERYKAAWIGEGVGLAVLGVGVAVEWRFGDRR